MPINTVQQLYGKAVQQLRNANIDHPDIAALFMIEDVFSAPYVTVLSHGVSCHQHNRVMDMVNQCCRHIPLAHILGYAVFNGHRYQVEKGVFIPRPETEELVAHAAAIVAWCMDHYSSVVVYELGVGTGVISIELAKQFPSAYFHGWDISEAAIRIASHNMQHHGVQNMRLHHGDFFISEKPMFPPCLLVSNPPYISPSDYESLDPVVQQDPKAALIAPQNGLHVLVSSIHYCAAHHLVYLAEMGHDQRKPLQQACSQWPLHIMSDITGHDRFVWYSPPDIQQTILNTLY